MTTVQRLLVAQKMAVLRLKVGIPLVPWKKEQLKNWTLATSIFIQFFGKKVCRIWPTFDRFYITSPHEKFRISVGRTKKTSHGAFSRNIFFILAGSQMKRFLTHTGYRAMAATQPQLFEELTDPTESCFISLTLFQRHTKEFHTGWKKWKN